MNEHGITHDPHHTHHHDDGPSHPFTEAQMDELHKSDIGAGGAVIVLMTAIFCIGLALYTLVAIVVSLRA